MCCFTLCITGARAVSGVLRHAWYVLLQAGMTGMCTLHTWYMVVCARCALLCMVSARYLLVWA